MNNCPNTAHLETYHLANTLAESDQHGGLSAESAKRDGEYQ